MWSRLLPLVVLVWSSTAHTSEPICVPDQSAEAALQRFHTGGEFSRVSFSNEIIKNKSITSLKTGNVNFFGGGWQSLQIEKSEFTRAYFITFKFQDVNLVDVDLRASHFRQAILRNVNFKNVDGRAIQMDSVLIENAHWDSVKLKGASIIFSKFKNCKLENIDWSQVVLVGTSFENCIGAPGTK